MSDEQRSHFKRKLSSLNMRMSISILVPLTSDINCFEIKDLYSMIKQKGSGKRILPAIQIKNARMCGNFCDFNLTF